MKTASQNIEFAEVKDLVVDNIKLNLVPALLGEAGIGKSSFLKAAAKADLNTKIFVLSVNTLAGREDLTGARLVKDEATNKWLPMFFPHESVTRAVTYAEEHPDETPILFLDEFNRTTPEVTSAIFQLITERRLGSVELPDNLRMVVAGNDVGNVSAVDSASTSRLVVYHVEPDIDTFIKVNPGLNDFVKDFLKTHPEHLVDIGTDPNAIDADETFDAGEYIDDEMAASFKQIATPRTWTGISDVLNLKKIDKSESPESIKALRELDATVVHNEVSKLQVLINAHIGENTASNEFIKTLIEYIDEHDDYELPSDDSLADPFGPFDQSSAVKKTIKAISAGSDTPYWDDEDLTKAFTWLMKDENASQFTKPQLTMFVKALYYQMTDIANDQLTKEARNAITAGIQLGTVSKENKMLQAPATVSMLQELPIMQEMDKIYTLLNMESMFD